MPDFAEHYGLRLVGVVQEWSPEETLLLIDGLPHASRFVGRLQGEDHRQGWDDLMWLTYDLRNIAESLRVMKINSGKKRGQTPEKYREFMGAPGLKRQKSRETANRIESLKKSLQASGGKMTQG